MPLHVSSACARNMWKHEIKLIMKQILCIKLINYWDKKIKIIIVIITVILQLPLAHYLIGLCFLQGPLPNSVF